MNTDVKEMDPMLQVAIINLIARVGIDATIAIMDGIKNAKTIDDAITALRSVQLKNWDTIKKGNDEAPSLFGGTVHGVVS